jgi:hypothetical protein
MLEELEIFQGVDFPLDCCLVDVILLQLSKYDLCRLAISISNRKKERGKKKPKQNLHRYAKNTLVSTSPPHLLFSRLLKKKNSAAKPPKSFNALPLLCCGKDFQRLHCISEDEAEEEIEI